MTKYLIYKIYFDEYLYIGSTIDINCRRDQHRQASSHEDWRKYNNKLYQHIRVFGGWENWTMEVIEEGEFVSKRHLEEIEDRYIVELKANLNSKRAYIKPSEWKSYRRNYHKQRYISNNIDKCLEPK